MLVPFFKSVPRKYIERKCKKADIKNVVYKVGVNVHFKEGIVYKPIKTNFSVTDDLTNIGILNYEKVRTEAESYKFALEVKLTAEEYKKINRHNEEAYITDKAKNNFEFKDKLDVLLYKMPDREYEVELFFVGLDTGEYKTINYYPEEEWTEYVAVY